MQVMVLAIGVIALAVLAYLGYLLIKGDEM